MEKKQKYHSEKKAALTQDHCFLKSRRTTHTTKKIDCPVTFTVKKIFRFPEFKINEKKKRKKIDDAKNVKNHIKYLKSKFEKKLGVTETFGHLEFTGSLPHEGHKYHHTAQAAGLIEPLDTRVSQHLKHAIQTGIHF